MKLSTEDCNAIANVLAENIFNLGDYPNSPCNRMQFKGGKWPDAERDQGGIVEGRLASLIFVFLKKNFPFEL